jgi:hypothetical protein
MFHPEYHMESAASGRGAFMRSRQVKFMGITLPIPSHSYIAKKGIKGTSVDTPITEHPPFGRIQWNQSYYHMPRVPRAPTTQVERVEEEHMDMDEPAT